MSPCRDCLKIIIVCFYGILFLIGVAVVGVAGASVAQLPSVTALRATPLVLLAFGVLLVLLAGSALCGVCCSSQTLLLGHALLMTLLLASQLVAISCVYLLRHQLQEAVVTDARASIALYGQEDHPRTTHLWDLIQMEFDCCGVANYTDWLESGAATGGAASGATGGGGVVPFSCCLLPTPNCTATASVTALPQLIHTAGCAPTVEHILYSHMSAIVAVVAVVLSLQVFGALLACCLARYYKYGDYSRAAVTI